MEDLQYKQMREREQAVIDNLNRKLKGAPNLSKLSGQLKIVSKRLEKEELWVMRDIVDEAIKFMESSESLEEKMHVEWVEINSAEDVEKALVGDELILWDGCNFAIDYVETEVDYGTSFFANGTEAEHYLRGLKPPKQA